jgi:hypothetical protein
MPSSASIDKCREPSGSGDRTEGERAALAFRAFDDGKDVTKSPPGCAVTERPNDGMSRKNSAGTDWRWTVGSIYHTSHLTQTLCTIIVRRVKAWPGQPAMVLRKVRRVLEDKRMLHVHSC